MDSSTHIERVYRTFDLSLRIKERWYAWLTGEVDPERRGLEGATCFLDVAADVREEIRAPLADAGIRFVRTKTCALRERTLTSGKSGSIANRKRSRRRNLRRQGYGRQRDKRCESERARKHFNH